VPSDLVGMSTPNNRVAVTGVGIICPLGLNAVDTWESIIAGKSGIDYITHFDPEPFDTRIAGEVKGFHPTDYVSRKDARHMDRYGQMAVAASFQAVQQAGITVNPSNHEDFGVIIGSGSGGITALAEQLVVLSEKGPDKVSPFLAPMMAADMAAAKISILLGAKGPNFCTTSSCSSSADAIGTAYEFIRRGDAQAMISGGSEAAVTPIGIAAFNACRALSTRNNEPQLASRPFDAERDGFVLGEGAGILILENLDLAKSRGARILAEITGYGISADRGGQGDKNGT